MNVAVVTHPPVNVNVVTTNKCKICDCDPCDCDWGTNGLFKAGNVTFSESLAQGLSSGGYYSAVEDLRLPVFDSLYNSLGTKGKNPHKKHYKSSIVDLDFFKVGDLVNWHPFWGLCDWNKPWIVKTVFEHDPLNCVYYDYEITDGLSVHKVTFAEIKKLEEK